MEELIKILIGRLVEKGMEVTTIPAYIRDVANTMLAHGYSSLQELNKQMRLLGWENFELDDHTLQLIVATFEPGLAYKPPHWFDRIFNPEDLHEPSDEQEHGSTV